MRPHWPLVLFAILFMSLGLAGRSDAQTSYAYRDIGTLGGVVSAQGASNQAEVVGFSVPTGSSVYHAFYWSAATGMLDIGGGGESYARAINNVGDVALRIQLLGTSHAFLWSTQTHALTDLNSISYTAVNFPDNATIELSEADDINDNRVVVGSAAVVVNGTTTAYPFMFDLASGTLTNLGPSGYAYGINNLASPQVVGSLHGGTNFLYSADTGITSLPLNTALRINTAGGVEGTTPSC